MYTKQITALVFLGVLIILCLFNLILGNKKAVKPRITPKSLLDGSYMEDYGNYFTERFWGRGAFKGLNFSVQTMFGKRESEGIYKGNKKYLLEEIAAPDERAMEENIRKIQELAGTYYQIPVYVMLAPNAAYIQPEKLPAYAVGRDQKKQFDDIKEKLGAGINWIEVSKALLKHSDEELYYRTDNNWTSLGAFYGYEALATPAMLYTEIVPGEKIKVTVGPKGFGSENMSHITPSINFPIIKGFIFSGASKLTTGTTLSLLKNSTFAANIKRITAIPAITK